MSANTTGRIRVTTIQDLAAALGVKYTSLIFWGRHKPKAQQYKVFEISKRSGGTRRICSPITNLKLIQGRLAKFLTDYAVNKSCSHAFTIGKSIVTNAAHHVGKRHVLNIDLKDFFPSINFGRVFGLLNDTQFLFSHAVASFIANVATFDGSLPQGSPLSPIISNMICHRLDYELMDIAASNKCAYSRYADDITFSTNLLVFPKKVARQESSGKVIVSPGLKRIIASNGFSINPEKIWMRGPNERREVTGLVVNKRVNVKRSFIRNVRAMLHCWDVKGHREAHATFLKKYNLKNRGGGLSPIFADVVRGKIAYLTMVRGSDDSLVRSMKLSYRALAIRDHTIISDLRSSGVRSARVRRQGDPKISFIRRTSHQEDIEMCVWIIESSTDANRMHQGSAFLTEKGFITAHHCCFTDAGDPYPALHLKHPRYPGFILPVRVKKQHGSYDLAALEPTRSIPMHRLYALKISTDQIDQSYRGRKAIACGYPHAAPGSFCDLLHTTVSSVNVISLRSTVVVANRINPGASGGPLVDDAQKTVIGIISQSDPNSGEYYCVSVAHLEAMQDTGPSA